MSAFFMMQQAAPSTDVGNAIGGLADFLLKYLTPLVVVWALSIAFVGLWKKLLDLHAKFYARRWVDLICYNAIPSGTTGVGTAVQALTQLLQLSSGVSPVEADHSASELIRLHGLPRGYLQIRQPAHYLFSLESDPMMGTVQEAVDTVFANPRGYESLYRALTNGARPSDVEEWLRWEGEALDHALPDDQQKAMARQSEVSSRLKKTVKSKLNSFRSYTSDSWQNWNELATSCIGVLIMFFGLVFSAWSTTGREFSLPALAGSFKLGMIPIALGTGILLPYVKDLLGTVRR